jgi:replication-associated recombination protein RarA
VTDRPTKNGYAFDEVASAFQKSIRRGLADDALYWAVELYISGRAEYAWKRMKIMASEDIGLAERHLPATLHALYQHYLEQSRKKDAYHAPERLFFVHAVLLLATAPKSRLCDHALIYHFATHDEENREVPDYAIDKHTRRGRERGRGREEFFTTGIELANPAPIEDPYRELAQRALERGLSARPVPVTPVSTDQDPLQTQLPGDGSPAGPGEESHAPD